MYDFLQELFELELHSKRLDFSQLPGAVERRHRLNACYDKIHAGMGLVFLDQLNDLETEQYYYEHLACFRHGFRLGIRQLLE